MPSRQVRRGRRSGGAANEKGAERLEPRVEPLERRLMMALSAHINFQPAGSAVPPGYVADAGQVFGNRGNGLSYGWNQSITTGTRERNATSDQRLDTLVHTQRFGERWWELSVPNGQYEVHLVAGDPSNIDSVFRFRAENDLIVDGTPTSSRRFIGGTKTVTVTDGRLTITNTTGAQNNKLAYLDVRSIDGGGTGKPTIGVAVDDADAAEAGRNPGVFRITRTGDLSQRSTIYFELSGNAQNGVDYDRIGGSATFNAGAGSTLVAIRPVDDSSAEGAEGVTIKLYPSSKYTLSTSSASITIADNDAEGGGVNHSPRAPVFIEPVFNGEVVNGADVHMETAPFSDPDAGDKQRSSDFEIWTIGANPQRVWHVYGETGLGINHVHFGDGVFEGPLAGKRELPPDMDFLVRARHRDDSGDSATEYSPWGERRFHTEPQETPIPNAPEWTVDQPGYKVEKVPITQGPGEGQFQLPVNIAFVQNPGPHPSDPLFYVTELYGQVRVVTRNYTVITYASGLLNYNPAGPFPGIGEQGLTGLAIDPKSGDLFVSGLVQESSGLRVPRVMRLHSTDGGLHASTRTEILRMSGEGQGQSHQVSNVSIGPDGKLYVHNGDGFETATALNLNSFRGKILRMNLDGSAPSDNPFYNKADGINARDYVYAYGFRNPFGGAWRASDGQHYEVENGSALDRFAKVTRGTSYGWNGSGESMRTNALYNWDPPHAPVNLAFIQSATFGGSGFPSSKLDHAFVTESGPTYATGPQARGKQITEFVLDSSGKRVSGPKTLIHYTGGGKATAAGLAAGPDGLYFTELYRDAGGSGSFPATVAGASILRIRWVGTSVTADSASGSVVAKVQHAALVVPPAWNNEALAKKEKDEEELQSFE